MRRKRDEFLRTLLIDGHPECRGKREDAGKRRGLPDVVQEQGNGLEARATRVLAREIVKRETREKLIRNRSIGVK